MKIILICTKSYDGKREHWMIVPGEWKHAYWVWNETQGRLQVEKGIEPVWICDQELWSRSYGHVGKNELVILPIFDVRHGMSALVVDCDKVPEGARALT